MSVLLENKKELQEMKDAPSSRFVITFRKLWSLKPSKMWCFRCPAFSISKVSILNRHGLIALFCSEKFYWKCCRYVKYFLIYTMNIDYISTSQKVYTGFIATINYTITLQYYYLYLLIKLIIKNITYQSWRMLSSYNLGTKTRWLFSWWWTLILNNYDNSVICIIWQIGVDCYPGGRGGNL